MIIKENIRALGIDDGYFIPKNKGSAKLIGIIIRADSRIEGVISTNIIIDGSDSTEKIINMVKNSRFLQQITVIFLSGINFAGFNIVDIKRLFSALNIPIIVTLRKKPDISAIRKALKRLDDYKERISLIKKAGKIYSWNNIYFQCVGINGKEGIRFIKKFSIYSKMPEPIRLAHIIASGVTRGIK